MNNTATPTKTPGYNCRLCIWFDTTKSGKTIAYYWSFGRAIRIGLADAELFLAAEQADRIHGHPMTGKGF